MHIRNAASIWERRFTIFCTNSTVMTFVAVIKNVSCEEATKIALLQIKKKRKNQCYEKIHSKKIHIVPLLKLTL